MDTSAAQGRPEPPPEWEPAALTKVQAWRLERLLSAGYRLRVAERLASDPHVDLHVAVDLLKQGCSARLAAQILL